MRAIFWKTTRELLPWAVLGMLVMGAAWATGLRAWSLQRVIAQSKLTPVLLDSGVLKNSQLVGLLGGLILGILAGRSVRDSLWGLLVHRPLGRSRIFAAMSLAGVALYGLMVGLPLAGAFIAVERGWVVGPFDWSMAGPAAVGLLGGIPAFFGGMLIALRQARWILMRALLAVAMLTAVTLWRNNCSEYAPALGWSLGATVVLALAAWGLFLAHEEDARPLVARAARGAAASVGVVFLVLAGAMVVGALFGLDHRIVIASDIENLEYRLANDGQPIVEHARYGQTTGWTNLDGRPFAEPRSETQTSDTQPARPPLLGYHDIGWMLMSEDRGEGFSEPKRFVQWLDEVGRPKVRWAYVAAEGRVVGFDMTTWRRIGSFGPDGFAEGDAPGTDRLHGRLLISPGITSTGLLYLTSGVYRIDAERRTIKPLFLARPDQPVVAASENVGTYIGIQTEKTFELVSKSGRRPPISAPRVYEASEYRQVGLALFHGGQRLAVWYSDGYCPLDVLTDRGRVLVYDAGNGQLVQQWRIPRLAVWAMRSNTQLWQAQITPVAGLPFYEWGRSLDLWEFFEHEPVQARWFLAVMAVSAVLCALINATLVGLGSLGASRAAVWALIGLALGPSGVVLLLCMVPRPVKTLCKTCGRRRAVRQDTCGHCQAAWAPPPTDAIEIFA